MSKSGFIVKGSTHSLALALVAAVLAASAAAAQGTPATRARGEIRGQVVSAETQAPIGGARVEVTGSGPADSLKRAASGTDGRFRVQGLRPGTYRVRISALGFSPRELARVVVGAAAPTVDAGTVALTPAAVELSSVVVRSRKADVELAPDRNAYVVHDMPTTRGGTALDVLRNVPSVDVDIDNIVSFRGNSDVIVQINGRPSPMKAAQLGNFLAQLPADIVDKVEVVSNPSAREDATGVAGIINIVLKQEAEAGTSGGVTIGDVTTGTENIGGNYGYDRGPLSLFASYGLINDRRMRTEGVARDNLYVVPTTYLDESGLRFQKPLMHTFSGSAAYAFGKKDELSADVLFSTRTEPETFDVRYTNLDAARRVDSLSSRYTDGMNHESSLESSLAYKHSFAETGHRLSAELRFNQGLEGGPTNVTQHALALDGTPGALTARETGTSWSHPTEGDLKLDYARPLSKLLRFEAGYKGSLQQFHSTLDTRVLDITSGAFVPDSARIGDVTFDQWVHAAYGMLSAQLGPFTLQGGVRFEHVSTTFLLRTTGASYDNAYDHAYPSGLVIWHLDDAREVKLSYSTRINRPDDTDVLDPTPHILDPLNIRRGNPYLKPELIRALELGFQQTEGKVTLQVTPYFRRTYDAIRTLRTIDSLGVATQSYANIATSDASGLDVTVALGGGRLRGFAGASAYKQVSNASNVAQGLSVNTFGGTARTNLTFRVSGAVDAQALVTYQAPMDVVQGYNAARTRVSFAARRKFMEDQLSVTLRVLDPFSTSLERSTTVDPRFNQVSDRARYIRGVGLSVSWTFGKPDKKGTEDLIGEPPAA
jgi:outer membrane cobalamin receptor